MGLDINGTKFLLFARRHGVSFANTAMIGRQEMQASPAELADNLSRFGTPTTPADGEKLIADADGYSESFLTALGADEITSFDASTYESATVVHDFNQPIADEFKGRFSVVLDGGTLEHVFNYPVALKNCMEMVAEGGHFLAITPANNQLGHGFYQFSPELFFRVFSAQNGFEVEHAMIFEETPGSAWYDVADPDVVNERVTLINGQSSMLLIIAKRTKVVEVFSKMPQQSDYVAVWQGGDGVTTANGSAGPPRTSLSPLSLIRKLRIQVDRSLGMLERRSKHFKKVDLP